MKTKDEKNIDFYINNLSRVRLDYLNEDIYGEIISHTSDFIFIRNIKDWHYDGYRIFQKKYISKIKYGKLEKFRDKVMKDIGVEKEREDFSWLNLNSIETIFYTIRSNYNQIIIEEVRKGEKRSLVGKIDKYNQKNIYLRQLNIHTKGKKIKIKISIKDITCIIFKDEYSSILFKNFKI